MCEVSRFAARAVAVVTAIPVVALTLTANGYGYHGGPVSVCREPRRAGKDLWPGFQHYD